ncbi:hypothetical protein [Thermocrinis sp.]|jgi:hypothetical protein|uniref:hypothetical protein n=1 Tax=Thermocrinis sp. TaxID=2024383 RepID=UPI003C0F8F13
MKKVSIKCEELQEKLRGWIVEMIPEEEEEEEEEDRWYRKRTTRRKWPFLSVPQEGGHPG